MTPWKVAALGALCIVCGALMHSLAEWIGRKLAERSIRRAAARATAGGERT